MTAVDHVDFAIAPGEVVGFLGPNGAGKTTTIRMITCTSPLSEGSLLVFGLDVTSHPREVKAQIGVVPQDNNYDPDLSVLQNLITYGRYYRLDPKALLSEPANCWNSCNSRTRPTPRSRNCPAA